MAQHVPRHQRVADQIQREMAQIIRDEVRDTRLGMVTITAVRVTSDLSRAKIFFTTLDPEQHKIAYEVLNGAAPHLRSVLSHVMSLRMVPILHFVYDESIERGLKMGAMIYAARQRDEALRGGQEHPGTDDAAQVDSQAEAKPDEGRA
ncbi:MAG: ribosome-binding factor A [Gammaproteobacteria bacterium 28-57-27]|nr:MAG: ribosome-binding factor A [Gammaproteobacteria bacterium 28-57-27]